MNERLREDFRGLAICSAIASGDLEGELSVIKPLDGTSPFGQIMAALATLAFTRPGDHDPRRSTLETVRHQSLMTRGEFDPSAAVVAINKVIQGWEKSKPSLDWAKITRATYDLLPQPPGSRFE